MLLIEKYALVYLGITGLLGGAVLWALPRVIKRFEKRKLDRVRSLQRIQSVKTDTPIENPNEQAREIAVESIGDRFTIIRKGIYIVVGVLWLLLLGLPFYQKVPLTILSVIISASGIVIGIAARPILENFISGIQLSFSNQIQLGDTVLIEGHYGTIEDISTFHTVIKLWDWRRLIISNSDIMGDKIINYTVRDGFIWTYVAFWVAYDADLTVVKTLALETARQFTQDQIEQEPKFWVMEMSPQSIKCWVASWATSPSEAWNLAANIRTKLSFDLQERGIKPHGNFIHLEAPPKAGFFANQ